MRFKLSLGCIAGFAALLLPAATGGQTAVVDDDLKMDTQLSCPAEGDANSTIALNLRLENSECKAVTVRVLSSIVGNADQTLGGLRVFGPIVAEAMQTVPAAGGTRIGGCFQGTCSFPPTSCVTDADCPNCEGSERGVLEIPIEPPALPAELQGSVATQVIVTELEAGTSRGLEINQCFVEVL